MKFLKIVPVVLLHCGLLLAAYIVAVPLFKAIATPVKVHALEAVYDVSFDNASIQDVTAWLASQHISFLLEDHVDRLPNRVTINLHRVTKQEVIEAIAEGFNIRFFQQGRIYVFLGAHMVKSPAAPPRRMTVQAPPTPPAPRIITTVRPEPKAQDFPVQTEVHVQVEPQPSTQSVETKVIRNAKPKATMRNAESKVVRVSQPKVTNQVTTRTTPANSKEISINIVNNGGGDVTINNNGDNISWIEQQEAKERSKHGVSAMVSGADAQKLMRSLTKAQIAKLHAHGFLRASELSPSQRVLVELHLGSHRSGPKASNRIVKRRQK